MMLGFKYAVYSNLLTEV